MNHVKITVIQNVQDKNEIKTQFKMIIICIYNDHIIGIQIITRTFRLVIIAKCRNKSLLL